MRLSHLVGNVRLGLANLVRASLHPDEVPDPPPRFVTRVGGGDYRAIGGELGRIVIERGGLRTTDRILDIGSGVGRLAAPLTRYLRDAGRYEGFDIDAELVAWCERNITRRHPRFRFRCVNVQSGVYNPAGELTASDFTFPYESGSFELVVATSLFTHLLTRDAENYLRESARVLAPGGTLLATFFLLDDESRALQAKGGGDRAFPTEPAAAGQAHHVIHPNKPEAAVAYSTDWLRQTLARVGLDRGVEIHGGNWCGRTAFLTYQDVVIARKAG